MYNVEDFNVFTGCGTTEGYVMFDSAKPMH